MDFQQNDSYFSFNCQESAGFKPDCFRKDSNNLFLCSSASMAVLFLWIGFAWRIKCRKAHFEIGSDYSFRDIDLEISQLFRFKSKAMQAIKCVVVGDGAVGQNSDVWLEK